MTDRACADASILWNFYAKVCAVAVLAPVSKLREPRPPPRKPDTLCPTRCLLYASALLRFHFVYGDFIRWLSGEYTNHVIAIGTTLMPLCNELVFARRLPTCPL